MNNIFIKIIGIIFLIIIGGVSIIYILSHNWKTDFNESTCQEIKDMKQRNTCYYDLAKVKNNYELCEKIEELYLKENCFYDFAFKNNNPDLCEKTGENIELCYQKFASTLRNPFLCEKVFNNKTGYCGIVLEICKLGCDVLKEENYTIREECISKALVEVDNYSLEEKNALLDNFNENGSLNKFCTDYRRIYNPKSSPIIPTDCVYKEVFIQEICKDSDGGKDYYVKGICRDNEGTKMLCDICYGYLYLQEASCTVGKQCGSPGINNLYECPNGCYDGACVK